ncbi:hypothetical protein KUCAC02_013556, partial [Chaenocephalus aceratus]
AGVLPELQATSAGDCSLSTAINLAADRGLERQGAGGWSEGCCRQRVDGGRRERRTCRDETPVFGAPTGPGANLARQWSPVAPVTKVIIPTQAPRRSPH